MGTAAATRATARTCAGIRRRASASSASRTLAMGRSTSRSARRSPAGQREPAMVRRIRPWPATIEARAGVERLLAGWDDRAGRAALRDERRARRAARAAARRPSSGFASSHGSLRPDPDVEPESLDPGAPHRGGWSGSAVASPWTSCSDPELPPRVQRLTLVSVPGPPAALADDRRADRRAARRARSVLARRRGAGRSGRHGGAGRALRAAEAGWGPVTLGPVSRATAMRRPRGGSAGVRVSLDLEIERDRASGALTRVAFVPRPLSVVGQGDLTRTARPGATGVASAAGSGDPTRPKFVPL